MKRTVLLAVAVSIVINAHAQLDVNKPTVKTPASGLDPSVTGRTIMDVITPALKLTDDQTSKVTILVGQFLTHKSGFMELKSKPADYKAKFDDEQKVIFEGLKSVLSAEQFSQFMGLKPASEDAQNAMSHLFY